MLNSCPTCNLAELVNKRLHHCDGWMQFEEEAGRQRLARRLARWQEHRTSATGHSFTIATLTWG